MREGKGEEEVEGEEQECRHSPLSLLCAWGGFLSGVVTAASCNHTGLPGRCK